MRTGRYKKNFLTPDEVARTIEFQKKFFAENLPLLKQAQISEPEFVARFVLQFFKFIKPTQTFGARRSSPHVDTDSVHAPSPTLAVHSPNSALAIFEQFLLRGAPEALNQSLLQWTGGHYPLKLFLDIPTPMQVLKQQAQGLRCVSVITNESQFGSYILEERDPLSFTVHDLIHAHHFFANPDWKKSQIGFYKLILKSIESHQWDQLCIEKPAFQRQFEYLYSDMNSHPLHLLQYLKAITLEHGYNGWLLDLKSSVDIGLHEFTALEKLNTPAFDRTSDAVTLTRWLEEHDELAAEQLSVPATALSKLDAQHA